MPFFKAPWNNAAGEPIIFVYFHTRSEADAYAVKNGGYDVLETSPASIWRVIVNR